MAEDEWAKLSGDAEGEMVREGSDHGDFKPLNWLLLFLPSEKGYHRRVWAETDMISLIFHRLVLDAALWISPRDWKRQAGKPRISRLVRVIAVEAGRGCQIPNIFSKKRC